MESLQPSSGSAGGGAFAALAAIAVAGTLGLALVLPGLCAGSLLPLAALAAAFAAVPLALPGGGSGPAALALRGVGRATFYAVAFGLSFVRVAEAMRLKTLGCAGVLAALPCLAVAAVAVLLVLRRTGIDAHARGEAMLLTVTVVAFVAGLSLEAGTGAAIVANLSLAFLAAGRIVRGCAWLARGPFWEGVAVAAVLAATRIADVTLPGWPRATGAFFVLAAAGSAGLVFERRRAQSLQAADVHAG